MNTLQNSNSNRYKFNPIKLFAYFMVIMIVLTIFSNVASSLTVSIVTVEKIGKASINHSVSGSGMIEADGEINITADKGFTIKDINFEIGDNVKSGDILMNLDSTSLKNNIYNVETEIKKLNLELSQMDIVSNNVKSKETELEKKVKEIENVEKNFNIKFKQVNEDINITKEDIQNAKNKLSSFIQKDEKAQLDEAKDLVAELTQTLEDLEYQKQKDLKESQFNIDNAEFNLASIIKNEEAFASEELKKAKQNYENVKLTWNNKSNSANEDMQIAYINWQSLQEAYNQEIAQGNDELAQQYKQQMEEYENDYIQKSDRLEDTKAKKEEAFKKAEQAIEAAKTEKDVTIQAQKDKAQMEIDQAKEKYELLENDYNRKIEKAQKDLDEAQENLDKILSGNYKDISISEFEDSIEALEKVLKTEQRQLEELNIQKQSELDKINEDIENLKLDILNEQQNKQLESKRNDIEKQKILIDIDSKNRELNQLQQIYNKGDKIIVPTDGIITSIKTAIGTDTTNEVIATIAPTQNQYYIKIKVNKEKAKYIEEGDEAEVTFAGEIKAIEGAKVDTITALKGDDSDKLEIKILLPQKKGEIGMSASIEINKATEKYQTVIPISAIRENSSGEKYVLIVDEQNTIIGKQLVAQKVIVNEIERDNYNVAVEGSLTFENQIITSSSKPIISGDRVRLIEQ